MILQLGQTPSLVFHEERVQGTQGEKIVLRGEPDVIELMAQKLLLQSQKVQATDRELDKEATRDLGRGSTRAEENNTDVVHEYEYIDEFVQ